jgi:purine-binding chemotaxis protein CheW
LHPSQEDAALAEDSSARHEQGWLECRCAGRLCALPLSHVVEVMRPLPVLPAAGAPHFILGLSIIRGTALPVVSAARLLGAPEGGVLRFVSIQAEGCHAALAVEDVLGLSASPANAAALPPLLGGIGNDMLSAIAVRDADFLLFLNLARVAPLIPPLLPPLMPEAAS